MKTTPIPFNITTFLDQFLDPDKDHAIKQAKIEALLHKVIKGTQGWDSFLQKTYNETPLLVPSKWITQDDTKSFIALLTHNIKHLAPESEFRKSCERAWLEIIYLMTYLELGGVGAIRITKLLSSLFSRIDFTLNRRRPIAVIITGERSQTGDLILHNFVSSSETLSAFLKNGKESVRPGKRFILFCVHEYFPKDDDFCSTFMRIDL